LSGRIKSLVSRIVTDCADINIPSKEFFDLTTPSGAKVGQSFYCMMLMMMMFSHMLMMMFSQMMMFFPGGAGGLVKTIDQKSQNPKIYL
jgi:hypothetical protein